MNSLNELSPIQIVLKANKCDKTTDIQIQMQNETFLAGILD